MFSHHLSNPLYDISVHCKSQYLRYLEFKYKVVNHVYVVLQAIKFDYEIEIIEPDTPWKYRAKELAK